MWVLAEQQRRKSAQSHATNMLYLEMSSQVTSCFYSLQPRVDVKQIRMLTAKRMQLPHKDQVNKVAFQLLQDSCSVAYF